MRCFALRAVVSVQVGDALNPSGGSSISSELRVTLGWRFGTLHVVTVRFTAGNGDVHIGADSSEWGG